jgi:hypothetical protein
MPIFNVAVWPFADGDVVVQPCVLACGPSAFRHAVRRYNTVCALASLQSHSDAVLCLHNADAAAVCKRRLNITHPSMKDINSVFATQVMRLRCYISVLQHPQSPSPSTAPFSNPRSPNSYCLALPAHSSLLLLLLLSTLLLLRVVTSFHLLCSSSYPCDPYPPFGRTHWRSKARVGTLPSAARLRC